LVGLIDSFPILNTKYRSLSSSFCHNNPSCRLFMAFKTGQIINH
jgi:hypothetical protein